MKRILNNKKGMTLVELIVAVSIFTIFSVSCMAVLVPVVNVFAEVSTLSEVSSIVNTLANSIVSDLSSVTQPADVSIAGRVEIVSGNNHIAYFTKLESDGKTYLWREQNGTVSLLLPKEYYNNKNITTEYSESVTEADGVRKTSYTISIKITSRSGSVLLEKDILVVPLVLNLNK